MNILIVAGIVALIGIIYRVYDWYTELKPLPWSSRYWYTCTLDTKVFTRVDLYDMYLADPHVTGYFVPYTDPDTVMGLAERLIGDLVNRTRKRRKRYV